MTKCDRGGKNWPKIAWRTLWTAPNNAQNTIYADPAWSGVIQASDRLKIYNLQRKHHIIEYTSHAHPTAESKMRRAEEKLFRKVTVEEEHVLRQYLPQNTAITYALERDPLIVYLKL